MGFRIGIDVGGTFTDFVLMSPRGELVLGKSTTVPGDESAGVMNGIADLARREARTVRQLLADTEIIVHGTTIADNTMIEMNGAVTGLLTTEGHRDQIEIRRGFKEQIWDPAFPPPVPIAARRRRLGIPERLDFHGHIVTPLDEAHVRAAVSRLKRQGVESIAVCFLFSYVNPKHERRVREIIREEYAGADCDPVRISLSHEVMPTAPEFERTSTTLVDAYVGPRVERYLSLLESRLCEAGYSGRLLIMQSNGGVMTAEFLKKRAVAVLGSGPTGGVIGACAVAKEARSSFIAVDMGGTSYEVCVIRGGRPNIKSSWNWYQRYLVGLPLVEMHAIGAGGGSIASVEAGTLTVGPRSAGASPGPICYGRGGTLPTVTDANLVLGYLNPVALCGGEFELKASGVREAILDKVGRPLGVGAIEAAHGIFRIVNANMANAIRRVSSQAGLDPREFGMVVYGGNGPIHAGKQAEELGIRKLLVPKMSPAFSALGLLMADHVVDAQRSYIRAAREVDPEETGALFDEMEEEAVHALEEAGLPRGDLAFERFLNISYPGQTFDMSVPITTDRPRPNRADIERTIDAFHDMHEALHTYAVRDQEPLVRSVRTITTGRTKKPRLSVFDRSSSRAEAALTGRRQAFFDGAFVSTPVFDGDRLECGHRIEGPAIIEERFTTIVLYPGHVAEVDAHRNTEITIPSR